MDQPANDNPPSGVVPVSAAGKEIRDRTPLYARLTWLAFCILLAAPYVVGAYRNYEPTWPGLAAVFGNFFADGYAIALQWGKLYWPALLWSAVGVLATRNRMGWTTIRRRPVVTLVRVLLFGFSAWGLTHAVEKLAFLTDAVVETPFFEPPEDEEAFRDTLLAELGRAAVTMDFDAIISEALARGDIDHARVHVQAAELVGAPLKPSIREAYDEANSLTNTVLRGGWDALRGLVTGESDSVASFVGALAGDLTPYGDVRDITRQLGFKDKPDELVLGLSVLGLSLTALSFIAPQQATPIKTGKAALKTASRFAKASAGVSADIRRITTNTVDLPAFNQAARNFDITPDFAVRFVRRQGIDELGRVSTDLYDIGQAASTGTALAVLKHADTLADLPFYKRIAKGFGESADGVVAVLGKNAKRAFRVFKAGTHLKAQIDRSVAALVASIAGLLLSLSGSVTSFVLKKLTLGFIRA